MARREDLNTLAAQVVYKHWSAFPGVLEPTVVCTDGGAGACGLTPPKIDWHDTFVVRVGADQGFRIARGAVLHARGGGFFETTPLPSDAPRLRRPTIAAPQSVVSVPTRYFDSDRIALTVGTGLTMHEAAAADRARPVRAVPPAPAADGHLVRREPARRSAAARRRVTSRSSG